MEFVALAVIAVLVAGIVVRVRWEKRNNVPEYTEGEAVGGWFGGVGDR